MPKVGAARCGRDGDVLPCRGGWEEAWARSVWVVVGRWLDDYWGVVVWWTNLRRRQWDECPCVGS